MRYLSHFNENKRLNIITLVGYDSQNLHCLSRTIEKYATEHITYTLVTQFIQMNKEWFLSG